MSGSERCTVRRWCRRRAAESGAVEHRMLAGEVRSARSGTAPVTRPSSRAVACPSVCVRFRSRSGQPRSRQNGWPAQCGALRSCLGRRVTVRSFRPGMTALWRRGCRTLGTAHDHDNRDPPRR
uniref:Uncharacterized protein n=1 Tax=Ralstonia solanacearum TaxID=305 RepID=A0A809E637_RALSL